MQQALYIVEVRRSVREQETSTFKIRVILNQNYRECVKNERRDCNFRQILKGLRFLKISIFVSRDHLTVWRFNIDLGKN